MHYSHRALEFTREELTSLVSFSVEHYANGGNIERLQKAVLFVKPDLNNFPITCKNCIFDAIVIIKNFLNKPTAMETKKCQYKMIPGNHYFRFLGMHVSNNNITDELAEQIIEDNPKNTAFFEYAPKPKPAKIKPVENEIVIIPADPPVETDIDFTDIKAVKQALTNLGKKPNGRAKLETLVKQLKELL